MWQQKQKLTVASGGGRPCTNKSECQESDDKLNVVKLATVPWSMRGKSVGRRQYTIRDRHGISAGHIHVHWQHLTMNHSSTQEC